jgi:lantibiotic modifying enzyme
MNAWCHGAPGVLLSRVAGGALPDDAATQVELDAAFATTLRTSADEHTLCHGEIGNLLIAARAASVMRRTDWQQQLDNRLAELLTTRPFEPRCGFTFPDSVPSLMTGISGIGYGLLSLSAPTPLPCILSLEPPTLAEVRSVISECQPSGNS